MARDVVLSARLNLPLPDEGRSRVIDLDAATGNTRLDVSELSAAAAGHLSCHHLDLIEAAAVILIGDIGLPRGRAEEWSRDITFHLPAASGSRLPRLAHRLEHLLEFVLGDSVTLQVHEAPVPPSSSVCRAVPIEADSVCLLSGGIDSLAGAVALLEAGRWPVLLSHETGNPVTRRSRDHARRCLQQRYGPVPSVSIYLASAPGRHTRWPYPDEADQEPSRRSRSLLPLAASAALADAMGVSEVWVPENGVMAAQLPLTRARVGTFTTRTTHPRWLQGLASLFSDLLNRPIQIANPLLTLTKAEILEHILLRHLGEEAIRGTDSCWAIGRQALSCGGCIPCLVRGFAFAHCGLAPEATASDPFEGSPQKARSEGRRNLTSLLSLVRDFSVLDAPALRMRYPELAWLGLEWEQTLATFRRFAVEVAAVCRRHHPWAGQVLDLD